MKVTLIDFTGRGTSDPTWYAAKKLIVAKNTRVSRRDFALEIECWPTEALNHELEAVALSIRSSWEFVNYTFKIEEISRACSDQIVRTRYGVAFAVMAQRVVDNSQFDYVVPETVAESPTILAAFHRHMSEVQRFYHAMVENGIPAQDARAVLPMATYSPLTADYDLRALADVCGKRENLRAQGEYAAVAREMKRLVLEVHPWTNPFLEPERTATPNLEAILRETLGNRSPVENARLNDALKELDRLKGTWG
jgi:flavin-dependent thymidylate synthase